MANSVNAGTNELKRANFGSSWSSGKQSMNNIQDTIGNVTIQASVWESMSLAGGIGT